MKTRTTQAARLAGESTMSHQHEPDLRIETPTDREVVMTRVFDAPRALVFEALTRPELLKLWLQAPGRTLDVCEIDLRQGGAYRYVFRGAGKRDVGMHGEYREVAAPARLVRTEAWEDWDAGLILSTTVLTERAGRTTLTTTDLYPSKEVRDSVMKSGLEANARTTYDNLAEYLASAT